MRYETGEIVRVGDKVTLGSWQGEIVFCVDTGDYSDEYPQSQWDYLERGTGILTVEAGLVVVEDNEDLTLRASPGETLAKDRTGDE